MGTKNKIQDLNNILFEALERVNDTDLEGADLMMEVERSKSICSISNQILIAGSLALKAEKLKQEYGTDLNVAFLEQK